MYYLLAATLLLASLLAGCAPRYSVIDDLYDHGCDIASYDARGVAIKINCK